MLLFDLHCDTIDRLCAAGTGYYATIDADKNPEQLNDLAQNDAHISLARMKGYEWCQCFAIFMPDDLRGQAAIDFFERHYRFFRAQMDLHADMVCQVRSMDDLASAFNTCRQGAMLTVEGGSVLAGDIGRVSELAACGVRILTLVWNGPNELGSGNDTQESLTAFGRLTVPELERVGILIDVSHINKPGFWELESLAKRPYVATHSNARAICNHPRNLDDDQFRAIVERKGLVGLNFADKFLAVDGIDASFDQLSRHVEHFLKLGGEDVIALGSDYDGADIPSWLCPCDKLPELYALLRERFGETLAQKICGNNAQTFMRRYEQDYPYSAATHGPLSFGIGFGF